MSARLVGVKLAPKTPKGLPPTPTPVLVSDANENVWLEATCATATSEVCSIPSTVPLKVNELPPDVKLRSPSQTVSGVNASVEVGAKPMSTGPVAVYWLPDCVN